MVIIYSVGYYTDQGASQGERLTESPFTLEVARLTALMEEWQDREFASRDALEQEMLNRGFVLEEIKGSEKDVSTAIKSILSLQNQRKPKLGLTVPYRVSALNLSKFGVPVADMVLNSLS